jgi:hypothetical protein
MIINITYGTRTGVSPLPLTNDPLFYSVMTRCGEVRDARVANLFNFNLETADGEFYACTSKCFRSFPQNVQGPQNVSAPEASLLQPLYL